MYLNNKNEELVKRIFLFFLVILNISYAIAECLPQHYPIGSGYYCSDRYNKGYGMTTRSASGTSENAFGTQVITCNPISTGSHWLVTPTPPSVHKCYRSDEFCGCTSRGCSAICTCSMGDDGTSLTQDNWMHEYCYRSVVGCKKCPIGNYRKNCGCENQTGSLLFPFIDNSVQNKIRAWTCLEGTCTPCPKGHYCPIENMDSPLVCPAGFYQPNENSQNCLFCYCRANQYRTNDACDPETGFECAGCDECTPPETITSVNNCPTRNYIKGKNSQGKCVLCEQETCIFPKVLYGNKDRHFCHINDMNLEDNFLNRCGFFYFDKMEVWSTTLVSLMQSRSFQSDWTPSLIRSGKIPWKQGFRRIKPTFTTPLPGLWNAMPQGYNGQLPFYVACPDFDTESYSWTQTQSRINYLNSDSYVLDYQWFYDCDMQYALDCKGKPKWHSRDPNLLVACEPCPSETFLMDGKCMCNDGFASTDQLISDRPFPYFTLIRPGIACHDCSATDDNRPISWRKSSFLWVIEALLCYQGSIQTASNPMQYLAIRNEYASGPKHEWKVCDAGYIPDDRRTSCIQCTPGKYSAIKDDAVKDINALKRYECRLCPLGTYTNTSGATSCIRKRTSCGVNNKIIFSESYTEDHVCSECSKTCPEGQVMIFSDDSNGNVCDESGLSYFGCFSGNANQFLLGTRVSYTTGYNRQIGTETCDSNKLPPHSYFVRYWNSDQKGLQCYFSCLHGVNHNVILDIRKKEQEYSAKISQLSSFLIKETETTLPLDSSEYAEFRAPKPIMFDSRDETWMAEHRVTKVNPSQCPYCHNAIKENTFLFREDLILTNEGLYGNICMSPERAYTLSCPRGMFQDGVQNTRYATRALMNENVDQQSILKCAYDARNSLFTYYDERTKTNHALVAKNEQRMCNLILSDPTQIRLERFEVYLCTKHCLDKLQETGRTYSASILTASQNGMLLSIIREYLTWNKWKAKLFDPYSFTTAGTCDFTCIPIQRATAWGSFRADFGDFYSNRRDGWNLPVCISCSDKSIIEFLCEQRNQVVRNSEEPCNTGREIQNTSVWEITLDSICTTCDAIKQDNGRTIATLLTASGDLEAWWRYRQDTGLHVYIGTPNIINEWTRTIKCRYACSQGYYPNSNAAEYASVPCLPCQEAIDKICAADTFKNGSFYKDIPACGIFAKNMEHVSFSSACKSCRSILNAPSNTTFLSGIYNTQGDCLATCDKSRFHNFDRLQGYNYTPYPIPYARLACQLCSFYPDIPCNSTCIENYYLHDSRCMKCNMSSCGAPDEYKEKCFSPRTSDARCEKCPTTHLLNHDIMSVPDSAFGYSLRNQNLVNTLRLLINESSRLHTRQYVEFRSEYQNKVPAMYIPNIPYINSTSVVREQCILVCKNNFVWIDIATGVTPFAKTLVSPILYQNTRHFCVPCNSLTFMKRELVNASRIILYSVWNLNNNVVLSFSTYSGTSILYDMSVSKRLMGGCYRCANQAFEITRDNGTSLCETMSGFSNVANSFIGSDIIFTGYTPASNGTLRTSSRSSIFSLMTGGRRRLLQVEDNTSGIEEPNTFVMHRRINIRRHPSHLLKYGFSVCCDQLYTTSEERERCKEGKLYELEPKLIASEQSYGNTYCDNIRLNLARKPTRRIINQRKLLQVAEDSAPSIELQVTYVEESPHKCPVGTFKEEYGDGPCLSCPPGASTIFPFTGSVSRNDCVCLEGYKTIYEANPGIFNFRCEPCGYGYYRSYNTKLFENDTYCLKCPSNTFTPTIASSQCYCLPGFYLNQTSNTCEDCPSGMFCEQNRRYVCPEFSSSPLRSSKRGHCVCNNDTHFGILEDVGTQCMELTPGIRCQSNTSNCTCGSGWIQYRDPLNEGRFYCITPCLPGQYVNIDLSDNSISSCINCPLNTYSSSRQAIGPESCVKCPFNTYTEKTGSTNISDCKCNGNLISQSTNVSSYTCEVCLEGSYMQNGTCKGCPQGFSSQRASIGIESCLLCPKGHRTVRNTNILTRTLLDSPYLCEPCPVGMFSSKIGTTCTPCANGYTTRSLGSTSPLFCVAV